MPRPSRLRGFFEPAAGWMVFKYISRFFHIEQVADLIDHAANFGPVVHFHGVSLATQAEAPYARLMRGESTGGAFHQRNF